MFLVKAVIIITLVTAGEADEDEDFGNYRPVMNQFAQVSLRQNGKQFGVGVIISPRVVLTTWNILQSKSEQEIKVLANCGIAGHPSTTHSIRKIVHQTYTYDVSNTLLNGASRPINNLALILIDGTFDFSRRSKATYLNVTMFKYGFRHGDLIETDGFDDNGDVSIANLPYVDHYECRKKVRNYGGRIYDGEFCAGDSETCLCEGDEGTPLIHQGVLIGIASWIYGCDGENHPAVIAEVWHHRDWIRNNMMWLEYSASKTQLVHASSGHSNNILVTLKRNEKQFGLGVIIGSQFVLTTASLVNGKPENEIMMALIGSYETYGVKRIDYYYDRYAAKMLNGGSRLIHNIAIIQTNRQFSFDKNGITAPLPLVPQAYKPESGKYGGIPVIDLIECNELYQNSFEIYQGELCVRTENLPSCNDIEGSALIVDGSLLGIPSYLDACDDANGRRAVLLHIGFYRDWIDASMDLMFGKERSWFTRTWSDPWFAEKWFEETFKGGDESCEIGPKRERIRGDHCYRGCDINRSVHGKCINNQCVCPNMAGDLPLYDLMNGISRPDWKDPYCGERPCKT